MLIIESNKLDEWWE